MDKNILTPPSLEEITERIISISDPLTIYLFGSYGRGEQKQDSDVDLLVILDGIESPRFEANKLRRVLRDLMYPIDIIVTTPRQLNRHKDTKGLIYKTVLDEGVVIYERNRE